MAALQAECRKSFVEPALIQYAVRLVCATRDPARQATDAAAFRATLEAEFQRADFDRNGWSSALNATAICDYWAREEPGLFDDLVAD